MIENIETYFLIDKNTPHKSREENYRIRKTMACNQANNPPVQLSKILEYVNEFLNCIEDLKGEVCEMSQKDKITLDWKEHDVIGKGIIVKECKWIIPIWDETAKRYSVWEPKYSLIQKKFGLSHTKNILWLKFTKSGHLGVVARGMDINFDYNRTSGKLIREIGELWDESFVLIFPLTDLMLKEREDASKIEIAVGNYLISKNVPIIDFYSHNYQSDSFCI